MFGIDPDLTVMAKAIGAGFPVAAVGGSREVMEQAADGRTMHGGTYNSNPLVCAAVIAACRETGARRASTSTSTPAAHGWPTGLVEAAATAGHARPAGAASARSSSCGSSPQPPNDYREAQRDRRRQPVLRPLPRAARPRRADPAAAGGPLADCPGPTPTPTSTARSRRRPTRCRPSPRRSPTGRRRPDGRTAMRRVTGFLALAAADGAAGRGLRRRHQRRRLRRRRHARSTAGSCAPASPTTPTTSTPPCRTPTRAGRSSRRRTTACSRSRRRPAAPARQVVPDIASAMPTVTDGGKTYTFHVRPGVMFSPPVSREVKPSDFKFSIERLFRVDSGGVGFYTGIVGRGQLRARPARAASRASSPTTRR